MNSNQESCLQERSRRSYAAVLGEKLETQAAKRVNGSATSERVDNLDRLAEATRQAETELLLSALEANR